MTGISLVHEIVQRVQTQGSLGPNAENQPLEEPEKELQSQEWMIDHWVLSVDDALGLDLMPGRGHVLVEQFQGSGTFGAHYEGNSRSGSLDTVYKNGDIVLNRCTEYRDDEVQTLQVFYHTTEQGAHIFAELYHFDRENPANSYAERQGWTIAPAQLN